ncbi:cupin domain-containing protein [Pseudotenacibaculum sp. MALMAid0570]|uniref:cupin domain-containing protein n=1 Tax=Pseudotenacibaculum sp. MALMAid0570 TaxID=3143938 RepID=UPI0032DEF3D3
MLKKSFSILLITSTLFFSCQENTPQKIEKTILLETTKSWNGNPLPVLNGQTKVTISKIVIPSGAQLPWHIHPVITTGILTKGELTITDKDGNEKIIKAGDVLVEVSNERHFGKNTGNSAAEILVFYVGEKDSPTTIIER